MHPIYIILIVSGVLAFIFFYAMIEQTFKHTHTNKFSKPPGIGKTIDMRTPYYKNFNRWSNYIKKENDLLRK